MAKKKKKKHIHHEEPIVVNINAPLAYVSAMDALAYAQKFAMQREESAQMVEIANAWAEIGNQLLTHGVELVYSDEEETAAFAGKHDQEMVFGFAGGHNHGKEEAEPSTDSPEG
jgi:hypothetical protein